MAASSCPSSKDTVLALLSREVRFDNVQCQRHRQKRKQPSSTMLTPNDPRGITNITGTFIFVKYTVLFRVTSEDEYSTAYKCIFPKYFN